MTTVRTDEDEVRGLFALLGTGGHLKSLLAVARTPLGSSTSKLLQGELAVPAGRLGPRTRLLVISGLLTRGYHGRSVTYTLTPRGQAALRAYDVLMAALRGSP